MKYAATLRVGEVTVNNGVDEKKIRPDEPIPEGFVLGRLPGMMKAFHLSSMTPEANSKRSLTITGSKCFTNGSENKWVKSFETPPDGWVNGMTKRKKNAV